MRVPGHGGRITTRVLLAWAAASLAGCGAATPKMDLKGLLASVPSDPYGATCRERSARMEEAVRTRRYVPTALRVGQWEGTGALPGDRVETSRLAEQLVSGNVRSVLVEARAGLGKSKLAEALEAATCARIPTARVEMRAERLVNRAIGAPDDAALVALIAETLGVGREAAASEADFLQTLTQGDWILIADALDELPVDLRSVVSKALQALRARAPGMRLVLLARSPVFSSNFLLYGVGTRLDIEPLDVTSARERVATLVGDAGRLQRFWSFAQDAGLARTHRIDGKERFVHLATHRDIEVAVELGAARSYEVPKGPISVPLQRSDIYLLAVQSMLRAATPAGGAPPDDLIAQVDRMVDATRPDTGTRSFDLTRGGCVAVGAPTTCDILLGSPLFVQPDPSGPWRFANQSLADFFLARWADRFLGEHRGAGCDRVQFLDPLFESSEIAAFLVGQPAGFKCVTPIVASLCRNGCSPRSAAEMLDEGLPEGRARTDALTQISKSDSGNLGTCVSETLSRLRR